MITESDGPRLGKFEATPVVPVRDTESEVEKGRWSDIDFGTGSASFAATKFTANDCDDECGGRSTAGDAETDAGGGDVESPPKGMISPEEIG